MWCGVWEARLVGHLTYVYGFAQRAPAIGDRSDTRQRSEYQSVSAMSDEPRESGRGEGDPGGERAAELCLVSGWALPLRTGWRSGQWQHIPWHVSPRSLVSDVSRDREAGSSQEAGRQRGWKRTETTQTRPWRAFDTTPYDQHLRGSGRPNAVLRPVLAQRRCGLGYQRRDER